MLPPLCFSMSARLSLPTRSELYILALGCVGTRQKSSSGRYSARGFWETCSIEKYAVNRMSLKGILFASKGGDEM